MKDLAQQATRTHTIHLNGQIENIFTLFDPIGEKKWSEGWNPIIISPNAEIHEGTVFITKNRDGTETIWTITALDQAKHDIAYTAVTPSIRVTLINITCQPEDDNHTKAHVTYTITALSEKGKQYVKTFTDQHYGEFMANWEKAINHYLQHGRPLPHH